MDKFKVLNLGTYLAGPLTAKYLQQMGYKIITIKPPKDHKQYIEEQKWGKDIVKELCRDQKVLHINLKKEFSEIVDYIKTCDIIIENFRPNVMKSLGLDYEFCKSINPNVVYVSLPGFASVDDYRTTPKKSDQFFSSLSSPHTDHN